MGKEWEVERGKGRSVDPDREGKGVGKEWEVGRGKGRSVDPDTEDRGIVFWLGFGRDSVYNTQLLACLFFVSEILWDRMGQG